MIHCESCQRRDIETVPAVVSGVYYKHVCQRCLSGDTTSGGVASFERRRGYEDNAQDTIQPYDAVGPSKEFYRLYPSAARKIFSKEQIENLKRQI